MAINLGGVVQIGDKNVTSGLASNLDTAELIKSLVEAKSIPSVKGIL